MSDTWTPRREAAIRRGFEDGLSWGRVAAELGLSRNAVIGKAQRMGFFRRKVVPARVKRVKNPVRPAVVEPEVIDVPQLLGVPPLCERAAPEPGPAVAAPQPPPVAAPKRKPAPSQAEAGVELVDLQPHHCRFPLWGGAARLGLFCGEVKEPGRTSYCPVHRAACEPGARVEQGVRRAA